MNFKESVYCGQKTLDQTKNTLDLTEKTLYPTENTLDMNYLLFTDGTSWTRTRRGS